MSDAPSVRARRSTVIALLMSSLAFLFLSPCRVEAQSAPQWVEQGPGPNIVPGSFGYTEVSGAVEVIAPDPQNPNRVFIGSASGGIWRTMDATAARPTWVPLTDQRSFLSIAALAFDPLDPSHNTLYAGFGLVSRGGYNSLSAILSPFTDAPLPMLPGVLLKTEDGGETWPELSVPEFAGLWVREILPTPLAGGQVILAATQAVGSLQQVFHQGGIWRSANGGQSWSQVFSDPDFLILTSAFDLVEDPSTPEHMFAAVQNGVLRSDNGGQTWYDTALPGVAASDSRKIDLAMSPSTDEAGQRWLFAMPYGVGVFFSTDNGATWTAMDPAPTGSFGGTFQGNTQLAVSPRNPSLVFASGDGPKWRGDARGTPGTQWVPIQGFYTLNTSPHGDSRHWVFGADPDVLLESDDGGIYRLQNAGANPFEGVFPLWTSMIGTLRVTEFYSVAYDSVNHIVFGACQDDSIPQQTAPGNETWEMNENLYGDGIQVAVDSSSTVGASIHYSSQQNLLHARRRTYTSPTTVVADVGLGLVINGTGGRHYNEVEGAIDGKTNELGSVRFGQTWALNAVDGKRLLLGTDYLYESADRGDTFTSLGGIGLNSNGEPIPLNPVGSVTAYAYGHPQNPDVIYVGTNGRLYGESAPPGFTSYHLWLRRSGNGPAEPVASWDFVNGRTPLAIALSPTDWQRAYILDSAGDVWRTTDAGTSAQGWSSISGLGGTPLFELTTDLHTIRVYGSADGEDVVIVGGMGGVFVTRNPDAGIQTIWQRYGSGLPNGIVTDLVYDNADDVLLAGTWGRGAWIVPNASHTLGRNHVDFDIRPQSCPNKLEARDRGVLPAAILGRADFDVHQIDVSSVRLAGNVAPLRSGVADVAAVPGDVQQCACTSAGADGFADLTLKFSTADVFAAIGPSADGDVKVLAITGALLDGTLFEGRDCVVMLKQ